jgi:hypothetical protein
MNVVTVDAAFLKCSDLVNNNVEYSKIQHEIGDSLKKKIKRRCRN